MKKLLLITLAIMVIASGAMAKDKIDYNCSDLRILTSDTGDRVGGDTIGTATVITGLPYTDSGNTSTFVNDYDVVCPYSGSTAPDVVYSFTPTGDATVDLDLCSSSYDTKLYILTSDGVGGYTVVDCNDDSCPGYMSELFGVALTGGVEYFIVVDGYSSSSGDYVLNMDGAIVVEPPANDTCDGAINLDDYGVGASFIVDLCDGYTNAYWESSSCTNYSSNGMDAIYYVVFGAGGGSLNVCMDTTGAYGDLAIWLVTDCNDPANTCVAGDDSGNPECIDYSGPEGIYYLIVDAYTGCAEVEVTIDGMVPTADSSWSSVKTLY